MAPEKHASDPILAAIEAKIAAWTTVRDNYRAAVSLDGPLSEPGGIVSGVLTAAGAGRLHGHGEAALPVGVFRDKTIKEAIVIFLGAMRRKQTNREIAMGLQKGGIATTSKSFEPTVATALHRLKAEGAVLRFEDGWDLASSYPDSLRSRLEKDRKPRPKPKVLKVLRARVAKRTPAEDKIGEAKDEPVRLLPSASSSRS